MGNNQNKKLVNLAMLSIFTAIELIFCFTALGSLPIVPGAGIVATLSHIPVIIVALTMGKWAGMYMGAVFGVSSLIVWTAFPPSPLSAFAFSPFAPNGNFMSLIICIVPRVLFPLFTSLIFILLKKKLSPAASAGIAGGIGTFLHSFMVLSLIFISFRNAEAVGGNYILFIVAWAGVNALIEIAIAAILSALLTPSLLKIRR